MNGRSAQRSVTIAAIALAFCACAGGGSGGSPSAPAAPPTGPPGKGHPQIQHVVIVIQENRSVDNLFPGFPGADTQSYGFNQSGQNSAHARSA